MAHLKLAALSDLADPGSVGCTLGEGQSARALMLVRKDGRVFAYVNSCPHTGAPLDWAPGVFLDCEGEYIQCATHDALFRIDDGRCVHGPCRGERLEPVAVRCADGYVCYDGD